MTIFVTPDHDTELCFSDIELIELEAEVNDIHAELSGDAYADAVLASL